MVVLIKLVVILMISAKLATLGLFKIIVFWNNGYDAIVSVDDIINKTLLRAADFVVDGVM